MGRKIPGAAPQLTDQPLRYGWPGNVRELENTMERTGALARGSRVELDDLPEESRQALPKPVVSRGVAQPLNEIEESSLSRSWSSTGSSRPAPPSNSGSARRRSTENARATA